MENKLAQNEKGKQLMGFHIPKSKHKDMRNFEVGISLEHFIINLLLQKSKNML